MDTFWRIQKPDKPLFPDIVWERPESKINGGKLCLIGGNSHSFAAPALAYQTALDARIGVAHIILPDAIDRNLRRMLPEALFVPSTPSGSFAQKSLSDLVAVASNVDAVLLSGDFGRNSETAIVLEKFTQRYVGPLCITQDAVDYFKETPKLLLQRPDTLVVLTIAQLQKLFINFPLITPITYGMDLNHLAEALQELTAKTPAIILTKHHDTYMLSAKGQVISMADEAKEEIWRTKTASRACVFWLQHPKKSLEAITTSLLSESDLK
jgi:NAD(P)H-hydrate repair Nnr-like enzyme with NAD(P)H-hydrate dehydratase domain